MPKLFSRGEQRPSFKMASVSNNSGKKKKNPTKTNMQHGREKNALSEQMWYNSSVTYWEAFPLNQFNS